MDSPPLLRPPKCIHGSKSTLKEVSAKGLGSKMQHVQLFDGVLEMEQPKAEPKQDPTVTISAAPWPEISRIKRFETPGSGTPPKPSRAEDLGFLWSGRLSCQGSAQAGAPVQAGCCGGSHGHTGRKRRALLSNLEQHPTAPLANHFLELGVFLPRFGKSLGEGSSLQGLEPKNPAWVGALRASHLPG